MTDRETEGGGVPSFTPVSFDKIPGWADDDHLAAFSAFRASAAAVVEARAATGELIAACHAALVANCRDRETARQFFETYFIPCTYSPQLPGGAPQPAGGNLLTGYYEPEIEASRRKSERFPVPMLARPADLETIVPDRERGARPHGLTHGRRADDGSIIPYPTRREIDEGALGELAKPLFFLPEAIRLFLVQVQGSALLRLEDGWGVRVIYDGKNGHPYTSIGRHLIEACEIAAEDMSLETLMDYLREDPARARQLLWLNESYVFFRELGPEERTASLGTDNIPLSPLRSLAVDTSYHALGTPVFVEAPSLKHVTGAPSGFRRLLIAHDVGSAITGPERGDLFCGTGEKAGNIAGLTKHPVTFYTLRAR